MVPGGHMALLQKEEVPGGHDLKTAWAIKTPR